MIWPLPGKPFITLLTRSSIDSVALFWPRWKGVELLASGISVGSLSVLLKTFQLQIKAKDILRNPISNGNIVMIDFLNHRRSISWCHSNVVFLGCRRGVDDFGLCKGSCSHQMSRYLGKPEQHI